MLPEPVKSRSLQANVSMSVAWPPVPTSIQNRAGLLSESSATLQKLNGRRGCKPRAGSHLKKKAYFTPPPTAFAITFSCCRAFSKASSMLKLAGFWRGGNSWKVFRYAPTTACAGMSKNVRSAAHLS